MPDPLIEAYRATSYCFELAGQTVVLRIDIPSPELRRLYADMHIESAAYLTAWNPRSEPTGAEANAQRNAALKADIEALGLQSLQGRGVGPTGWSEASFLVPGITLEDARKLAERYGQNAFVFAGEDAVPRLVFC